MNWTDFVVISVNVVLSVALTVMETKHYLRQRGKAVKTMVTSTAEPKE